MQPSSLPSAVQDALRRGQAIHVEYADSFRHRLVLDDMPVLPTGWTAFTLEELCRRPVDLYVAKSLQGAAKRLQRLSREHGGYTITIGANDDSLWAHAPRLRATAQYRAGERTK
jgi:hypothetical protein